MLIVETIVSNSGLTPSGASDWKTFVANLTMMQMYPGSKLGSFGASGQTTSVAVEFHIYFFIGGLWFLCISRNRAISAAMTIVACTVPIANSLALPGLGLFIFWLAGFALYFALSAIRIDRVFAAIFCMVGVSVMYRCRNFIDTSDIYSLSNLLPVIFGFSCIVVASQCTQALMFAKNTIKRFADYSLTLFLTHMVIAVYFFRIFPGAEIYGVAIVWAASNLVAASLARFTEEKYKVVADHVFRHMQSLKFERATEQAR